MRDSPNFSLRHELLEDTDPRRVWRATAYRVEHIEDDVEALRTFRELSRAGTC